MARLETIIDGRVKKAIDRAEHRRELRQPIMARRRAVAELMRPLRDDWHAIAGGGGTHTEGKARGVRKYDSTGMVALDQAGATIYSMLTGADNIWAPLTFEEEHRREDGDARAWLAEVNRIVFASLDPARDNFYSDAPEVILDSIGLGDGVLYSARPPGSRRFVTKAIPWTEASFDFNAFGEVTHFDRRYQEPLWSVAELFGHDKLPARLRKDLEKTPNRKVDLLHTVVPREDDHREVSSAHTFTSLYVALETSTALSWGGYRDMPYHVARWGVGSGETYGLGRGIFALPDAQVVNEMSRTQLVAGRRQAEPPVAASDELAGLISLDPNKVNYGAIDERGNQLIRGIDLGTNVGISLEMADQRRQQIRDVFYHAMLSLVGSPTPSAVEILKNSETRDQSMGPNLGRINSEFFAPFVESRYRELVRAGKIPPPPQLAAGAPLRTKFTSPLAKAMRAQAANAVINTAAGIAQVAQIDPRAAYAIHGIRAAKIIADGFAMPEGGLATNEEIEELMRQQTEAAETEGGLEAAERGSRAVESLARAEQAAGGGGA